MNKAEARELVWKDLRKVALPDSRFHFDFNNYIPDFEGSDEATHRLRALDIYQQAKTIFITPDNCLEQLREQAICDSKQQFVTTYGVSRGIFELAPDAIPADQAPLAALLDRMETVGRSVSLQELRQRDTKFDLLVTGASAVSRTGLRFGKGHGFFDIEWAVFFEMGLVDVNTPVIAFVHDCQITDVELEVSPFDTVCDLIVTPTQVISVANQHKPTTGVLWDALQPGMMEDISLLGELKKLTKRDGKTN